MKCNLSKTTTSDTEEQKVKKRGEKVIIKPLQKNNKTKTVNLDKKKEKMRANNTSTHIYI